MIHEGHLSLAPALITIQLGNLLCRFCVQSGLPCHLGSTPESAFEFCDGDSHGGRRGCRAICASAMPHCEPLSSLMILVTSMAADVNDWYEHCKGGPHAWLWHGYLHQNVMPGFLMQQRACFCINLTRWSGLVRARRTATRHAAGKVQTRCLDSIDEAIEYMLECGTHRTLKMLKKSRRSQSACLLAVSFGCVSRGFVRF